MTDVSLTHLLVKALDRAGVRFPASRTEIAERLRLVQLRTSDETVVDAAALVRGLGPEDYENGAAFMCAVYNLSYRALYEK